MAKEESKGLFISVFLHIFVLFCFGLYLFVDAFFVEEIDDKLVFEMVEAAPMHLQSLEEAILEPQDNIEDILEKNKITEAKAIDLSKLSPKPEPKPEAVPTPKPEAKKVETKKPEAKKPEQKKISYADFKRQNPTTNQAKPKPSTKKVSVTVPAITYDGKNLDKLSGVNVGAVSQSGVQAENALNAYLQSVNAMAKSKWTLPSDCFGMQLSVDISFNISASGQVSGVKVLKSSGNKSFDNSVIFAFSSLKMFAPPNKKAISQIRLSFESQ